MTTSTIIIDDANGTTQLIETEVSTDVGVIETDHVIQVSDGGGGAGNSFTTIAVSGQSSVVADSSTDTLTLVAGSNVTITTDADTDTITIAASGGGGGGNVFSTIAVSGQSDVVADGASDTVTFINGNLIQITTNGPTDAVTFGLADIATARFLGRVSAGTGAVEVLTGSQVRSSLNLSDNGQAAFGSLELDQGVITGVAPNIAATQTWNSGITNFLGWTLDITDTASDVDSNPIRVRVNGSDVFTLRKEGRLTLGGSLIATGSVTGSNLSGTNTGDQTITLTGPVTGSGTGSFATSITDDAVTYAKLQNASAGNVVLCRAAGTAGDYAELGLAVSQLLGRGSTGNLAAIALGSNLSMSGTTLSASFSTWLTITSTAHGLVAGDVGKPIRLTSAGAAGVWDDASYSGYPLGILAEVVDANTIKLALAGSTVSFADTLLQGTDLAGEGRWYYWDKSQNAGGGKWQYELPDDTYWIVHQIEVLTISGGTVTAVVRDLTG